MKNAKISLIPIVICMFVNPFLGTGLNLSVLSIASEFQVDAATVGWIVTVYALGIAAFSIPLGKLADMFSRRAIFLAGSIIICLSSLAAAFSLNFAFLLGSRLVQSVGSAMLNASSIPIAIAMFPAKERGKILGITTASVYAGGAAGPVVGGFLNENLGWQSIFIMCAALIAISTLLALKLIPRSEHASWSSITIDRAGTVLYMLMIVLVLFGFSEIGSTFYAVPLLVVGLLFGAAFVFVESRAAEPIIRLSMFTKDRVFTLSCLAALLNYGATSAIGYLLSIYLQSVVGMSSQYAGLVMISQPLLMAVISPISGTLSDRIEAWKLASIGMAGCVIALVILATLNEQSPLWLVIIALLFAGVGFGLFSSPNTNLVMSRVDMSEFSVANTILAAMRTIGQTSSMCLVTVVVSFNLGTITLEQAASGQLVSTMQTCFMIFAGLCAVGLVMSLARKKS